MKSTILGLAALLFLTVGSAMAATDNCCDNPDCCHPGCGCCHQQQK